MCVGSNVTCIVIKRIYVYIMHCYYVLISNMYNVKANTIVHTIVCAYVCMYLVGTVCVCSLNHTVDPHWTPVYVHPINQWAETGNLTRVYHLTMQTITRDKLNLSQSVAESIWAAGCFGRLHICVHQLHRKQRNRSTNFESCNSIHLHRVCVWHHIITVHSQRFNKGLSG